MAISKKNIAEKTEIKNMKKTRTLSVAKPSNDVQKADINALVCVEIDIIGTKLIAEVKKGDNGAYTLLLAPKKVKEGASGCTLKQLIDAIHGFFDDGTTFDQKELDDLLAKSGKGVDGVTITLVMAFLYMHKKDKDAKTEVEYAFQIRVNGLDKLIPDKMGSLVKPKKVQLAIWNTSRTEILEAMDISDPDKYIENL